MEIAIPVHCSPKWIYDLIWCVGHQQGVDSGRESSVQRVPAGAQSDHENTGPSFGRQTSASALLALTVLVVPVLGVVDFYSEIQQGQQHMLLKSIASL